MRYSLIAIIICEKNISQVILFVKENTRLVIYAAPPDSFIGAQCNTDNSEITPIGTKGNVVCAENHFRTKRNYASDCRVRKRRATTDERLINSYGEWETRENKGKRKEKINLKYAEVCAIFDLVRQYVTMLIIEHHKLKRICSLNFKQNEK